MSASEYGFQIEAGLARKPYFEFSSRRVADEVLETAEQVLEQYELDGSPYNRKENVIEFEARPEYVRAVKEAVEVLQNDDMEINEVLEGGGRL
ncbi:MAG: hypothetical protein ABEJ75_03215 [Candidatus Nanohaloarchaea archaeon]